DLLDNPLQWEDAGFSRHSPRLRQWLPTIAAFRLNSNASSIVVPGSRRSAFQGEKSQSMVYFFVKRPEVYQNLNRGLKGLNSGIRPGKTRFHQRFSKDPIFQRGTLHGRAGKAFGKGKKED